MTMRDRLKEALRKHKIKHVYHPNHINAAVLVPLYLQDGHYQVLFIQRTNNVRHHKSQIGFPGGAYEESDGSLLATALRESWEEIGIIDSDVELLGQLDDMLTVSTQYIISPFVGIIPWPYDIKLDCFEIEESFSIPMGDLMNPSCLHQEYSGDGEEKALTYAYHYKDKVIWGATARILRQFLSIIYKLEGSSGIQV